MVLDGPEVLDPYLIFHGYDASDEGRSKLWIKKIHWDRAGCPTVSLNESLNDPSE